MVGTAVAGRVVAVAGSAAGAAGAPARGLALAAADEPEASRLATGAAVATFPQAATSVRIDNADPAMRVRRVKVRRGTLSITG
jgi:hypothetical protein